VLAYPVLEEIAAERIGDPSRDERWAVVYRVLLRILVGEATEDLWSLSRSEASGLWDALSSGGESRRGVHPGVCSVDGWLRVRSSAFEETDQRFLDYHEDPVGLIQEKLNPEDAANVLYSYLRSRKELLTTPVNSPIDFGLLSRASGEPQHYFAEKYNLIRLVLPPLVFVGYSEIEDWEVETEEIQEGNPLQQREMDEHATSGDEEVSYETFIASIEEFVAQEREAFTDKPSWLSLRVVRGLVLSPELGSSPEAGSMETTELTSRFLKLRLYDRGARVRVVPVVPEPVKHRDLAMTIANARLLGAVLMGNPQWKRDWLGRKSLVFVGLQFRVSPRREEG